MNVSRATLPNLKADRNDRAPIPATWHVGWASGPASLARSLAHSCGQPEQPLWLAECL